MYTRQYMAMKWKLYWRLKKNGKWTWKPAETLDAVPLGAKYTYVAAYDFSEEE